MSVLGRLIRRRGPALPVLIFLSLGQLAPAMDPEGPTQVTIEMRMIQMARPTAEALFRQGPPLDRVSVVKPETLEQLRNLVSQERVKVLCQPKITTISGNAAQMKSVKEIIYPTEFTVQPQPPDTNAVSRAASDKGWILVPGSLKTREVGTLLNVTPIVGADRQTINLTMIPEFSTEIPGGRTIEVSCPNGKVAVEQPLFCSRNLATSVVMRSGTTVLVGVADPIEGEARKNEDQVTLVFVTATVVGVE